MAMAILPTRSEKMNPVPTEIFGLMLILAYVLMCAIFVVRQK